MDSMCQQQCTWPQRTQHSAGLSLGPTLDLHLNTRAPQWSWCVRSAFRAPGAISSLETLLDLDLQIGICRTSMELVRDERSGAPAAFDRK
jgi:hypothetical protein